MSGHRPATSVLRPPAPAAGVSGSRDAAGPPGLVSAVVVLWSSRPHLPTLWDDLARQTYRPFELIVVDNASPDDSVEFVRSHELPFPVRLVQRPTNDGVTPAWNRALEEARGPWLLLLSPDCRFPSDLTERLVERATRAATEGASPLRVGGVSPSFRSHGGPGARLELMPHIVPRARQTPATGRGARVSPDEVFTYHGACALISTPLLRLLGGWDPMVNFGGDEVDLGLRAHLLDYRFFVVPELVADHPFEPRGKTGPARRLLLRSTWFFLLKNAGITIGYRALTGEAISYLFWLRYANDPRELSATAAWFVAVTPMLRERRRELRKLFVTAPRGAPPNPARTPP